MDISFSLFSVVVLPLFCTSITAFDISNNGDHDIHNFVPRKDTVIDTIHGYLENQEKRLATIKQYIKDYSEKHKEETEESSIIDDEEVKEEAQESKYFSTKGKGLCSGETKLPAYIQRKLKCRFVDRGIPFLKIAPFKEEEAYLDPRIVIYYDVINDEEIETLKELATPWLEPSGTTDSTTGEEKYSTDRISENAWIEAEENTHVKLLTRRLEHMTGLTADTADQFQVAYYSIGGLYQPHYDYYNNVLDFTDDNGNRISTVLFYMNDVARGGATIFPALDVAIWPRKGSAAFWYNLKQSGEGDYFTVHASCPILSGTKWVATKCLYEKGQEFLRPCTLSGYESSHQ